MSHLPIIQNLKATSEQGGFYADYGLNENELEQIVEHIESHKKAWLKELASRNLNQLYLRKEETGCLRTILFTKDEIYIHLKRKNLRQLGEGTSSKVTVSLKYEPGIQTKFVKVANVVGSLFHRFPEKVFEKQRELYAYIQSQNIPGVINFHYFHLYEGKKTPEKQLGPLASKLQYSLLTEYCDRGSLQSLIKSEARLAGQVKKHIATQVFKIINALHEADIAHRDLALANILLHGEELQVKIIDFADGILLKNQSEVGKIAYKLLDIQHLGKFLYYLSAQKTMSDSKHYSQFLEKLKDVVENLCPIERLIVDMLFPRNDENNTFIHEQLGSGNEAERFEAQKKYQEIYKNVTVADFLERLVNLNPQDFFILID